MKKHQPGNIYGEAVWLSLCALGKEMIATPAAPKPPSPTPPAQGKEQK